MVGSSGSQLVSRLVVYKRVSKEQGEERRGEQRREKQGGKKEETKMTMKDEVGHRTEMSRKRTVTTSNGLTIVTCFSKMI